MNTLKYLLVTLVLTIGFKSIGYAQFTLVAKGKAAKIYVAATEPDYVKLAVQDLVSDAKKITGQKLQVVFNLKNCTGNCVVVGTITNDESEGAIKQFDKSISYELKDKWEAYRVITTVVKDRSPVLLIAGSDGRGTMFGIYDFIQKHLGVDPLYFWKDREPARKSILAWNKVDIRVNEPSFKFRGWFINDEDLLTEWMESGGRRKLDYPFYSKIVSPEAIKHVFEAMVRLRMNMVIPASFIDIDNPAEALLVEEAAKRGLFLSMHHVEPMGVSAFTFFNYWEKRGKKPLFSFFSSRSELTEVWKYYANKWAKYPNVIWQVGLRGIADRPMWLADPNTPQSDADRGALISEAIRLQTSMIKEVDKQSYPLITTTLWAEGSQFFREGYLKIPNNVICIFSDNSPGWRWQTDFYETPRELERKYGVYYHHQLWGSGPHVAQGISPEKTYEMFGLAINKKSNEYAIMNVSNMREFVLGLEASAKMLYNYNGFKPGTFMKTWTAANFGKGAPKALKAYHNYFAAFQTPDKQKVPFLLDGQIRSNGKSILARILLQIKDPSQFKENEEKAKTTTINKSWNSAHLLDMNPKYDGLKELKSKLRLQQDGFKKAYASAIQAQTKMDPSQQKFLQANLISQLNIMLGLGDWLTGLLEAGKAYNENRLPVCLQHLEEALTAFDQINKGIALNSQGKWEHWYRGDKKMNLPEMETQTKNALAEVRKQLNK